MEPLLFSSFRVESEAGSDDLSSVPFWPLRSTDAYLAFFSLSSWAARASLASFLARMRSFQVYFIEALTSEVFRDV